MASKRQRQCEELIRRNFGIVLQSEGSYIFSGALVTVTQVQVSPDLSTSKIYVSVYNAEDKQAVIKAMYDNKPRLKQELAHRLRRQMRRVPDIHFYLDETLDEVQKLNQLFNKLHDDNQFGEEE